MASGNVLTIPVAEDDSRQGINISEELTRTGVWKSLPGNGKRVAKRKRSDMVEQDDCFSDGDDGDERKDERLKLASVSSPA